MLRSEPVVDPASRDKYLLHITAGPTRDPSTHKTVAVNGPDYHAVENDIMTCYLKVRIKDYHGLPKNSPPTSDYFSHPEHLSDRYSVAFSFVPKVDISGEDMVFGFDFDHSIKDRLPPGFKYAMRIVTTLLDPGIYSDPYSDKPYLYGPALSSFFAFRIGELVSKEPIEQQLETLFNDHDDIITEGATGSGAEIRKSQNIPSKSSKRRKNFLNPANLKNFTFEKGRLYQSDFFNPYLDFANFALRIPGFSISVARYIDDKTHQLRLVLKNRRTEEVLFVVMFTLLFGEKLENALMDERRKEEDVEDVSRSRSTQGRDYVRERDRSEKRGRRTSSEAPTPAASSRSSSMPDSDVDEGARQSRQTAASTLAGSIYSSFAALGFGRSASASSSENSSKETSPERRTDQAKDKELDKTSTKGLETEVDSMSQEKVAEFLKARHSST